MRSSSRAKPVATSKPAIRATPVGQAFSAASSRHAIDRQARFGASAHCKAEIHVTRVGQLACETIDRLQRDIQLGKLVYPGRVVSITANILNALDDCDGALVDWACDIARDVDQTSRIVAVATMAMALARSLMIESVLLPRIGAAAMALELAGWRPRSPKARADAEAFLLHLRRINGLDPLILDLYRRAIDPALRNGRSRGDSSDADLALKVVRLCGDYLRLTARRNMSRAQALASLMRNRSRADADALRALLHDIAPIPSGTMVKTANGHLGALLRDADSTPRLRVFYAIAESAPIPWQDFPISDMLALTIEAPEDWGYHQWSDDVLHLQVAEVGQGLAGPAICEPVRTRSRN